MKHRLVQAHFDVLKPFLEPRERRMDPADWIAAKAAEHRPQMLDLIEAWGREDDARKARETLPMAVRMHPVAAASLADWRARLAALLGRLRVTRGRRPRGNA